jgi:indole-3-glycerol phosphate synthase
MTVSDASTFLTKILDHKRTEVARQALKVPLEQLQANIAAALPPRAFDAALRRPGRVALIAEVKKASPSKGVLVENFDPLALARTYAENGAAAISVLTDARFFQGSLKYLQGIRERLGTGDWGLGSAAQLPIPNTQYPIPILRKDFILDPYQVYESRAAGADAILLIAEALDTGEMIDLQILATELNMTCVIEVHDMENLIRVRDAVIGFPHRSYSLLGINNRDLRTFKTNIGATLRLAELVEDRDVLISESGISTAEDVKKLEAVGVRAALVGETLLSSDDIEAKVRELFG